MQGKIMGSTFHQKVFQSQNRHPSHQYVSTRMGNSVPIGQRRTRCQSAIQIKEAVTGVEFHECLNLWQGESYRCLGAGARIKKILMIQAKVYAVALYVESSKAAKELSIRQRGGYFSTGEDYCQAVIDGAFNKCLVLELVRDVTGKDFADAIDRGVRPRLTLTGGLDQLNEFVDFFMKQKLKKGTNVLLVWRSQGMEATLDVLVLDSSAPDDMSSRLPSLSLDSVPLCRGLYEVFLGADSKLTEAKASWAKGAESLIELHKKD